MMRCKKMNNKTNTTQCEKCYYRWTVPCGDGHSYCGYILVTGHRRPCKPSPHCTVFKPYAVKKEDEGK